MASENVSWSTKLDSDSVEDQTRTLQEIASQSEVFGCTIQAVTLAGSRNDEVRSWAAAALESAIKPLDSEIESLADVLFSGEDGETCYWAATMLGRLGNLSGKHADVAVSALETCLSDSLHLPARERAAWALGEIGPRAASAATTLRRTAEDAPPRLQRLVNKALRVIGDAA